MDKILMSLFEQATKLLNMPLSSERATPEQAKNGQYYANEFLKMDYNSYYGGYRIDIVQTGTGETDLDGLARKSKKEMTAYLRGLIKGLTTGGSVK